jgi:hypothetical protein
MPGFAVVTVNVGAGGFAALAGGRGPDSNARAGPRATRVARSCPPPLIGALLIEAAPVRGHGDAPAAGGSAGASRSPAQEPKFWV